MAEKRTGSIGFIDAFWLKIIMAVLMVLDHLYYNLFPDTLLWGHYAARVVAPVFCYLVTEGMVYTRDRRRYIGRMLLFALVMLAGNQLLAYIYGDSISNSVIMSLAIGAAVIACIDNAERSGAVWQKILWALGVVLLFAASIYFNFEGQHMIPLMAVVLYYLRERPLAMWVVYFMCFSMQYIFVWINYGVMEPQFFSILAIIPISLYNGKRGVNNAFSKYFFYVFYPLHIWIIYLLEQAQKAAAPDPIGWEMASGAIRHFGLFLK